MEYFTKQWFLAHQPGYLQQTEDAEKARAAARRVVEAYEADSPLAFIPFEPHLRVLSLRCSGITCEELHWKFLKKMEANPKKEL